MIRNLSQHINLLALALVLAILAKLAVILKLGLRSISKRITNLMVFKHLHSTATCFDSYNSLCFKILDKPDSKFDLKTKEAFYINWRKLKRATKSFSSFSFTITSVPPCSFLCDFVFFQLLLFLFFFYICVSHSSIIFIVFHTNYWHLSPSYLHVAFTSSHHTTPCIRSFSFIYCSHYLYTNYQYLLLFLITLCYYFISL